MSSGGGMFSGAWSELGFLGIGVKGRDRRENPAAVLHHLYVPGRHGTPVAHPVDDDVER